VWREDSSNFQHLRLTYPRLAGVPTSGIFESVVAGEREGGRGREGEKEEEEEGGEKERERERAGRGGREPWKVSEQPKSVE